MIIRGKVELTINGKPFRAMISDLTDIQIETKAGKLDRVARLPKTISGSFMAFGRWPYFCGFLWAHRYRGSGICSRCGGHRAPARATS